MLIGFLGAGTWGFCLANLLASKGHKVIVWAARPELVKVLNESREHPKLPGHRAHPNVFFTNHITEALVKVDFLAEAVTSAGIRQVFDKVRSIHIPSCPIVLTSKGIEQNTGLLLTESVIDVLGENVRSQIGCLSGPTIAEDVAKQLPSSVVCSAYSPEVMLAIQDTFATPTFRVYPNADIQGVQFGGAMKNIIAIACGISDGLGFGDNTKAALMTRGLHEIRKLAVTKGCKPETINGLAGMGDLCVTCLSTLSRNYRFGRLIAQGLSPEEAKKSIGMVVEGAYTCVSAMQLSEQTGIDLPICWGIHQILYHNMLPLDAVKALLQRATKEEHL
jgi:glycerol-3-phosphate dehydrogenase (NAD(P)+)